MGFRKFGRLKGDISTLQRDIKPKKIDYSYSSSLREIVEMEKKLDSLHNKDKIYWK